MRIPDIGDFTDVPVIEVHVAPGDVVAAEDPVLTLESDKATMDIPAPAAGTVEEVVVGVGSRVSTGDLVLRMTESGTGTTPATHPVTHEDAVPAPVDRPGYGSDAGVYERIEVVVPELGDFADVPVIEVLVGPGDRVGPHSPVVTLESDKAVMEIPASQAGTVEEVAVRVGDRVSAGSILRSEEHTSELQSRQYLVCRLLLEKKKTRSLTARTTRRAWSASSLRAAHPGLPGRPGCTRPPTPQGPCPPTATCRRMLRASSRRGR